MSLQGFLQGGWRAMKTQQLLEKSLAGELVYHLCESKEQHSPQCRILETSLSGHDPSSLLIRHLSAPAANEAVIMQTTGFLKGDPEFRRMQQGALGRGGCRPQVRGSVLFLHPHHRQEFGGRG